MSESREPYANNRHQVRIKEISQWGDGIPYNILMKSNQFIVNP